MLRDTQSPHLNPLHLTYVKAQESFHTGIHLHTEQKVRWHTPAHRAECVLAYTCTQSRVYVGIHLHTKQSVHWHTPAHKAEPCAHGPYKLRS